MKQSPKLKPNFWDTLVVLAVVAMALFTASQTWQNGSDSGTLTVVVSADGAEIDRFLPADLVDAPRTYTCNGVTLTVGSANGNGIRVESSDCPTQDCVHTGAISRSGQSIVCLPGRMIVQLTGGVADPNAVDVIIG